jgi:hypothetical protein
MLKIKVAAEAARLVYRSQLIPSQNFNHQGSRLLSFASTSCYQHRKRSHTYRCRGNTLSSFTVHPLSQLCTDLTQKAVKESCELDKAKV